MNHQEKGERGLGQSPPLSSFYAIALIDILHGAVCPLLMILIPCAVDDAHGIFSKGGKKVLAVIQSLHCCEYPGMDTRAKVYVQPEEVEKFQKIYQVRSIL